METKTAKLERRLVKAFSPPDDCTVSEWAARYRRLSPESSAEAGLWRNERTPYLVEIMDAFTDPQVRHIVLAASSQVGKSETLNNIIGYIIAEDPGSILFIMPTTIDAKEYSKLRITPMIRDCIELRRKVAAAKSRDSGNTILQKNYPGGILTMCGSGEAHSLASKPIRYVIGDERDRWATSAGIEGDPWALAMARQTTFYNAKSIEVSTPTIKGASAIEKAYEQGTQERLKTRCPACGEYNEIKFTDIRYTAEESKTKGKKTKKVSDIYYICPSCGAVSKEEEMKKQPSRWEAQNPDALAGSRTRSFWLSAFVSPWATWESIIQKFVDAQGDREKLKVVYNTSFGQLWEDRGDTVREENLMERREEYEAELPDGVLVLTMGVDTQDDRFEYEIVGHGHFGETWGIKKGIILARPDSEEAWRELDTVREKRYRFQSGYTIPISLTFIDEQGHFTQEVRQRCRDRMGRKIFPIRGQAGGNIPYTAPPKKQRIVRGGKVLDYCWEYTIGVDAGKQIIMDNLRTKTPGPRYCHFPARDDYGEAYFTGLLSEHLTYDEKKKYPWTWVKIPGHERNEPLDIRNYANAAFRCLSVDLDELEREIRAGAEKPKKTQSHVRRPAAPRRNNKDEADAW